MQILFFCEFETEIAWLFMDESEKAKSLPFH